MITLDGRPSLDESRRAGLRSTVTQYTVAALLCLLAQGLLFNLWKADFRVPFYYPSGSDLFPGLLLAKNIVETGSVWIYPRAGAPGILDHHDYSTYDGIHFVTIKLIASLFPEPGVTFNLFFLSTFLLITWTSLYVMRRLGISGPIAVVASLLYAFAPYHFMRGQVHISLGAYFAIPPLVLLLLRLSEDRPLFVGWDGKDERWIVRGLSLITCILVAGSGIYAVFFGLYFIVVASLIGFSRNWRGIPLLNGAIAAVLLFGLLMAQAVSTFQYHRVHGKNPSAVRRDPGESVTYALSLGAMVRPTPYHQFKGLARWALGRPSETGPAQEPYKLFGEETRFAALGTFATCGFLGLLLVPFLVRMPPGFSPLLDPLGKLTLASLLIGVPGGLGLLIASYVTPNIRAYNRVSIYIAYFSVLAAALLLDRLRSSIVPPRRRLLFDVTLGAILAVGLIDQMPRILVPDHRRAATLYARDREFFGRVEASLRAGSMVFQLPYAPYPEGYSTAREVAWSYLGYEHIRPYFHTNRLRWSSPAIKGREADRWQARLWTEPPEKVVAELTRSGFGGISIDRDGYDDRAEPLIAELREILGSDPLESPDHRFAYFALAPSNPPAATGGTK